MTTITKDMTIGEILSIDINSAAILMNSGMHCIGCPSSQAESLEEACMVHGIDSDAVVEELNAYFADKARVDSEISG